MEESSAQTCLPQKTNPLDRMTVQQSLLAITSLQTSRPVQPELGYPIILVKKVSRQLMLEIVERSWYGCPYSSYQIEMREKLHLRMGVG